MEITSKSSQNIHCIRAIAIFSVICAHCNAVNPEYSFLNIFAASALRSFGSVGVGIFLVLAGFLFNKSQRNAKSFFVSKVTSIIIPWMFSGTLVYLYVYLRKGGLSVLGLIKYLLGVETYLYYLVVLFALYALCFFVRHNTIVLYGYLGISVVSNLLTGLGYLERLNHYLNPLNFMIFFVIGILLGEYNLFEKLLSFAKKGLVLTVPSYLAIVLLLAYNGIIVNYFWIFFLPIELLAILCVFGVAAALENAPLWLADLGKTSFAIYLFHMPFAGIIANIFNRIDFWGLTVSRSIIVLAITYLAIKIIYVLIAKKMPCKNLLYTLMGLR